VSVSAKIARQFGANKPDTPTLSMRIPSSLQTLLRTLEVQNCSLNAIGVRPAEVVIEPDVTGFELPEFMRARELFTAGEKAALVQVPKIQQLLARLDPVLFKTPSVIPTVFKTVSELQSA
jgi:NTE family protein